MDVPTSPASWRWLTTRLATRRRLAVAAFTGLAVVCGLNALRPPTTPTRRVLIAVHDLSGGSPLAAGDLAVERLPSRDVPAGAFSAAAGVTGRLLAGPMRRGEPVTDVRLLSPSLLTAADQPDAVAVPVRVADGAAALALVHVGDVVDVIATADPGVGVPTAGSTVVHDVRVLATPATGSPADAVDSGDTSGAGLLIVAATDRQAAALAQAGAGSRLSVAVRRPS
jgi:Flp pilus assembly protein CpaB